MSWQQKPLGEVITLIQTGTTPSTKVAEYFHGDIPWYTPGDIGSNRDLRGSMRYLSHLGVDAGGAKLVEPNTLLITCIGEIGRVGITRTYATYNQQITGLRFHNYINVEYAYYWFLYHQTDLELYSNQAVVPILNNGGLKQLVFSFPPLDEQKRIAAILEEADHARRTRRYTQSLSDTFLQEVFVEMFGDPVTNPMGWERATISQLGEVITGNTPSRENPEYYGDFIEWIKSDNIVDGQMYLTRSREMLSELGLKVGRYVEPSACLVTCIAGSVDSIGSVAFVDRKVSFNQQINAVRPYEDVHPLFLYGLLFFSKPIIQDTATSSMKRIITKSKFEQVVLFKPPNEIQVRFAQLLEDTDHSKQQQHESARQAEHLFQSLLHRAFRGEL